MAPGDTDLEKVLDKIRKCLALSKSSNEHEAAAALRQAQKLMAMHRLSEGDVEGVEYISAQVLTDYEWPVRVYRDGVHPFSAILNDDSPCRCGKPRGDRCHIKPIAIPLAVNTVSKLIQWAMGVDAVYESQEKGQGRFFAVRYFGPRDRVTVAEHAHTVVARAVKAAWTRHAKENPQVRKLPGARAGFYVGWCNSVKDKVARLVREPDELRKIAAAQRRHYGGGGIDTAETNRQRVYADLVEAGAEAAADFNINKPIERNRLKIGHGG